MAKSKKPDYLTYHARARKAKEKVLNRLCTKCKQPLKMGGVSPYPYICKKCLNSL